MTCREAKEQIAASWLGDDSTQDELNKHLAICAECSAERTALTGLWQRLGDMPAPEPSPALDARWQSSFESLLSAQNTSTPKQRPNWFTSLWPKQPVWQFAVAMACLAIGVFAGTQMPHQKDEIARLREEVASTRDMVALSLLQQQSATERLRGVSYTGSMRTMDPQVISALTDAVGHDASVNVRLAAIDALSKAAGSPRVLESLTQSLRSQESPMVQAALIDYLLEARDRTAVGTLRQFAAQPDVNPAVLERAHFALQQLSK
jgi:hypothetical protein